MKLSELAAVIDDARSRYGDPEVRATWESIVTEIRVVYMSEKHGLLLDVDQGWEKPYTDDFKAPETPLLFERIPSPGDDD